MIIVALFPFKEIEMDVDKLDYFAVHAPDVRITIGDVRTILNLPNSAYDPLPTTEQVELAACIKRYEWARIMLKAKQISATRAASK